MLRNGPRVRIFSQTFGRTPPGFLLASQMAALAKPPSRKGRMALRFASVNDLKIDGEDRLFHWPQGPRPADQPGLSDLGL